MGAFISRFVADDNPLEQRQPTSDSASSEIGNEKAKQRSTSARQSREPRKPRDIAQKAEVPATPKIYKTTLEANITVPVALEAKEIEETYNEPETPVAKPLLSDRLGEIEEAVIKIQAGIRGYLVRKRLKELEEIQSSASPIVPPPPNFSDAESDIDLNTESQEEAVSKYIQLVNETNEEYLQSRRTEFYSPSEEEIEATKRKLGEDEAAVKIQSAFRGHLCRKNVAKEKEKDIFFDANDRGDLSNDVLIQNALNLANDKITDTTNELSMSPKQSNVPSENQIRCEDLIVFVEEQPPETVKITVEDSLLDQTPEDEAAVKIQAAFRGYQVRKSISREASPIRRTEINIIPEVNQPSKPSSLLLSPEVIPSVERESIIVLDELENELMHQLENNVLSSDCTDLVDNYSLAQSNEMVLTHNVEFQTPGLNDTKEDNFQKLLPEYCTPHVFSMPEATNAQNEKFEPVDFSEISSPVKETREELHLNDILSKVKNENKDEETSPKLHCFPDILNPVSTPAGTFNEPSTEVCEVPVKTNIEDLKPSFHFQSLSLNENKDENNEKIAPESKAIDLLSKHETNDESKFKPALNLKLEDLKEQTHFQFPTNEKIVEITPKLETLPMAITEAATVVNISEVSSDMKSAVEEVKPNYPPPIMKENKDVEDVKMDVNVKPIEIISKPETMEIPTPEESIAKLRTEFAKIVEKIPEVARKNEIVECTSPDAVTIVNLPQISLTEIKMQTPSGSESKGDEIRETPDYKSVAEPEASFGPIEVDTILSETVAKLMSQIQSKSSESNENIAEVEPKNEVVETLPAIETKATEVSNLSEVSFVNEAIEELKPSTATEPEKMKEKEDNRQKTNTKHKEKEWKWQPKEKCQDRNKKAIKNDVFETKPIVSKLESTSDEAIVFECTGNASVAMSDDNSTNRIQKETDLTVEIDICESLPKAVETGESELNERSIETEISEEVLKQKNRLECEETVTDISDEQNKKCDSKSVVEENEKTVLTECKNECKKTEYITPIEDLFKETDVVTSIPEEANDLIPECVKILQAIGDIKGNLNEVVVEVKETESIQNVAPISQQSIDLQKEIKEENAPKSEKSTISIMETPPISIVSVTTEDECGSPPVASGCSNLLTVGTVDDSSAVDGHSESQSLGIPRREIRSQSPNPFGRRRRRGKKHQKQ